MAVMGRGAIALATVLAGMLLAGSTCAFALNPALDVSQYAHTAWKIREGFSKRKEDGTLWATTEVGLSRLKNGRITTFSSKNGLPCDAVHWTNRGRRFDLAVHGLCLVRIPRSELNGWGARLENAKDAKRTIQAKGIRAMN